MMLEQPANLPILTHLTGRSLGRAPLARPEDFANPYYNLGSHPDIVERIWDKINPSLPVDCRRVVYGTPGLVHPISEVILALGYGTQYILRLPPELHRLALEHGAVTFMRWSGGHTTDLLQEYGSEWSFGHWDPAEPEWCLQAYQWVGEFK